MEFVKAFVAGFLSTVVFHQGVLTLLYASGATTRAPYSFDPTSPLQVPQVISLAFWGGLWGMLLWLMLRTARSSSQYWLWALILGALGPSAIALFVVFPLKGQPFAGGWQAAILIGALILNGAWGLGVALFMRLFNRSTAPFSVQPH